jgi:ketosteroid isomerase-like protein
VDTAALQDSLRQADQAWSEASATLDGHMNYVMDNAVILAPNQPMMSGKDAIRKEMEEMYQMPGFTVKWEPKTVEVAGSGDLGYTMGSYKLTWNDTTGNQMTDTGKYLSIWKMQDDGSWKVSADMFNSDMPMQ